MKANWNKYDESGANPCTACESGSYYYFYDALGNVNGVLEGHGSATPAPARYYRWEMDAFGNPDTSGPSANPFLAMDQPGPKEHLTGKLFDTITGLYYFHARWYDAAAGRFISPDIMLVGLNYIVCKSNPTKFYDVNGLYPVVASSTSPPDESEGPIPGVKIKNAPEGIGSIGSTPECNCDTVLMSKYFTYWASIYIAYKLDASSEIPQPEGFQGPMAITCPNLKRLIEYKQHSSDTCVNQCVLEHEWTHYSKHRDEACMLNEGWKEEKVREMDAYCVTLKCMNRLLKAKGANTKPLPAGCAGP